MTAPSNRPTPGIAVAALVLAILCPPIGLILGIVAYTKIKNSRGALGGDGLAIAAMVMPAAMVPIAGILAAIAIPNFIRYQLRAKQSEVKVVMRSIKTSQESFNAEYGAYVSSAPIPASPPGNAKVAWEERACPKDCGRENVAACTELSCAGFSQSTQVYYRYACETLPPDASGKAYFTCVGVADLDGDGELGAFLYGNGDGTIKAPVPAIAAGICDANARADELVDCRPNAF